MSLSTVGGESGYLDGDSEPAKLGQTAVNNLGFSAADIQMGAGQMKENFRKKFMDSYGVEIEFPAYYSEDGVIVPHKTDHVLSLGFHSVPRNQDEV